MNFRWHVAKNAIAGE